MMVPAADAAIAIQAAAERTACVLQAEMESREERHRAETESREARHREEMAQLREHACELEDELHWHREALEEAGNELALLRREASNASNFLAASAARAERDQQIRARQLLEEQLSEATKRIESLLTERSHQRFHDRHASNAVKQPQIEEGEALRVQLTTKASARETLTGASATPETKLTPQRINQLAKHIEAVLFGAGRGDLERTQLLLAAVLDRPVVQRLLSAGAPQSLKAIAVSKQMLESARKTLAQLSNHGKHGEVDRLGRSNDQRGTRSTNAHLAFETIVTALLPDDAPEGHMLRTIERLLDVNHDQLKRAVERKRKAGNNAFLFVEQLHQPRKRRKDARDQGRALCVEWWHANTRFDTCAGARLESRATLL